MVSSEQAGGVRVVPAGEALTVPARSLIVLQRTETEA
jgi:hypothetical protein